MPNLLPGGKSDKIPPSAFPPAKVRKGARVESEHTSNKAVAREIARDHLTEDMNYYEKLRKMEKKAMLLAFEDELDKIAMSGVEAASTAERNMGNAGILSQRPMIQAGNRKEYLQAAKLHPRGPARRAFLGHQFTNQTGFVKNLKMRRFLRLSGMVTGH